MTVFPATLLEGLGRSQKLKACRKVRAEAEALSDKDLADTGLKRYQLAPVARVRALKS